MNAVFSSLPDDMSNNTLNRELKLHSPAGVEPAAFTWLSADRQVRASRNFRSDLQF